ncbi:MAG: hypothetical protein M1436_09990 [Acidobacteria bacterium]|nr:hypothetical protein [Acidobacteriota bacterium]
MIRHPETDEEEHSELDSVTLYTSETIGSENSADDVHGLLERKGIFSVVSPKPYAPRVNAVTVARSDFEEAHHLLDETEPWPEEFVGHRPAAERDVDDGA